MVGGGWWVVGGGWRVVDGGRQMYDSAWQTVGGGGEHLNNTAHHGVYIFLRTSPVKTAAAVQVGVAKHTTTVLPRRLEALRRRAHRRRSRGGVGVGRS